MFGASEALCDHQMSVVAVVHNEVDISLTDFGVVIATTCVQHAQAHGKVGVCLSLPNVGLGADRLRFYADLTIGTLEHHYHHGFALAWKLFVDGLVNSITETRLPKD